MGKFYLYETVIKILGCATFVSYDPEQTTRISLFSLRFLALKLGIIEVISLGLFARVPRAVTQDYFGKCKEIIESKYPRGENRQN